MHPTAEKEIQNITTSGGRYIIKKYLVSYVRLFIAIPLWGIYILISADLSNAQILQFFMTATLFLFMTYTVGSIFTFLASRNIRSKLKKFDPGKATQNDEKESVSSWIEIQKLPVITFSTGLATFLFLSVLPVWVMMINIGGASNFQATQTIIGGLLFGPLLFFSGWFNFDRSLTPVRDILIPDNYYQNRIKAQPAWIRTRTMLLFAFAIFGSFISVVGMGHHNIAYPATSEASGIQQVENYLFDAFSCSLLFFIPLLLVYHDLLKSIHEPLQNIINRITKYREASNDKPTSTTSMTDELADLSIVTNYLLMEVQQSQVEIEQQIDQRTNELTRRTLQLQSSAQVAREAASVQDVRTLLNKTVELISDRFNFYHAGIYIIDENKEYALLQAASSKGGKQLIEEGYRIQIGRQGIIGSVAHENRAHVAMDVSTDPSFITNPALPQTQSEAAFPLSVRSELIGVLDIQSNSESSFTQSDIELYQALADQIALAIQNAQLLENAQIALAQVVSSTNSNIRTMWSNEARKYKSYRYTPLGIDIMPKTNEKRTGPKGNHINIPITLRGQKIGMITLHRKDNALQWLDADRALALNVANQIGLALENARLLEDLQQRAAKEELLAKITSSLGQSLDPNALLQNTVKELHQLPDVEEVTIFIGRQEKPHRSEDI